MRSDMRNRVVISLVCLLFAALSCTNFDEKDYDFLEVDNTTVSFDSGIGKRYITVRSGTRWDIPSHPSWVHIKSLNSAGDPFKWRIELESDINWGSARNGTVRIVNQTSEKTVSIVQESIPVIKVSSIVLDKSSLNLKRGEYAVLNATVLPEDATDKSYAWSSSDASVVSVDSDGLISALSEGFALVTATTSDGGLSASCAVAVTVPVSGIILTPASLALVEGSTAALEAAVLPEDATNKEVAWSSDNPSVATVSRSGIVTAVSPGDAVITVTSASDASCNATCAVAVSKKYVHVGSVAVSPESLTLKAGEDAQLQATVLPEDATEKGVAWSSGDASIVSVDSDGRIHALSAGFVLITATTFDSGLTASCAVTVSVPVSGITLAPTSLALVEGTTSSLEATVLPSDATNKEVVWSSDNPSVATVSQGGIVTAVSPGDAVITVASAEDSSYWATCAVTVTKKYVQVGSVTVSPGSLALTLGEGAQLQATVLPEDATDKSVTWSVDEPSVASVDQNGYVTTLSVGTARVKATSGGKSGECAVTVLPVSVTSVSLSQTSLTLTEGEQADLQATVLPANATNKDVNWTSSNSSIATVSSYGRVTAVSAGTAVITAASAGNPEVMAQCLVIVNAAHIGVQSVTVYPVSVELYVGQDYYLQANVYPADATDKTIAWSSSDESVVSVDYDGRIYALSAGYAFVTATAIDGGKSASCYVTVKEPTVHVTQVYLDRTELRMSIGSQETLHATVLPSNATDKSVTWSSSDAGVASVSSTGVVHANATGTATITVTTSDGGLTASCHVTVDDPYSFFLGTWEMSTYQGVDEVWRVSVKEYGSTYYLSNETRDLSLYAEAVYDEAGQCMRIMNQKIWEGDEGTDHYEAGLYGIGDVDGNLYFNSGSIYCVCTATRYSDSQMELHPGTFDFGAGYNDLLFFCLYMFSDTKAYLLSYWVNLPQVVTRDTAAAATKTKAAVPFDRSAALGLFSATVQNLNAR